MSLLPVFDTNLSAINYWGDQSDGAVTISTNTTIASNTGNDDDSIAEKHYSSLTINAGDTLSFEDRVKMAIIYVDGDCTINGTLKIDYMGASGADAGGLLLYRYKAAATSSGTHSSLLPAGDDLDGGAGIEEYKSDATAGAGGAGSAGAGPGNVGGTATLAPGGGGGGGAQCVGNGGAGAAGTAYSGGSAGAGNAYAPCTTGNAAAANAGTGGAGTACSPGRSSMGGAGHLPGANGLGSGVTVTAASQGGGGGVLILCVKGALTIGASGIISSDGAQSAYSNAGVAESGGGSAGGGRVIALYAGTLTNNGTIRANGGVSVDQGTGLPGGNGGAGVVTIDQVTR
jgi:hypothetical protein